MVAVSHVSASGCWNISPIQQALAAVDRLIDWFASVDRKCRFGKLLEEVDLETLRQVALGQSVD